MLFNSISEPEIKWNITDSEVYIYEEENTLFCFFSEIASAIPYQVEVGVRSKTANGKIILYMKNY